jgi:hypothetical protein
MTDERYFPHGGATLSDGPNLSLIACKDSSDEILVAFKLFEDGRQKKGRIPFSKRVTARF